MIPMLVINVLVILGPSVATIYYSLTDWAGIGSAEFVGLQNYRDLLADTDFWMAMWHNEFRYSSSWSHCSSCGVPCT
jgi:raffinose/stachyose/melibiose transport system permease protein